MTNTQWIRSRIEPPIPSSYNEIVQNVNEWSEEFIRGMKTRLQMGTLRYGPLGFGRRRVDQVEHQIVSRWKEYRRTGNREHLIDLANFALCEYVERNHPKSHFRPLDRR